MTFCYHKHSDIKVLTEMSMLIASASIILKIQFVKKIFFKFSSLCLSLPTTKLQQTARLGMDRCTTVNHDYL